MSMAPAAGIQGSCVVTPPVARSKLANVVNLIAGPVVPCCWKLGEDDPDSLCVLRDAPENDLANILRLCQVYGPSDSNISKAKFEQLASQFDTSFVGWSVQRGGPSKRSVPFMKIGHIDNTSSPASEMSLKPSDEHGEDGQLQLLPSPHHTCVIVPREARIVIKDLVDASNNFVSKKETTNDDKEEDVGLTESTNLSPAQRLCDFIETETCRTAAELGHADFRVTQRRSRHLCKLANLLTKEASQHLFMITMKQLDAQLELDVGSLKSPDRIASTRTSFAVIAPASTSELQTKLRTTMEKKKKKKKTSS